MPSFQKTVSKISPEIIPRPRLLSRLENHFSRHSIVLISAPGGYGKSTILSQFLHNQIKPYVWYNATSEDHDPKIFLNALASSLFRKFGNRNVKAPFELENIHSETSWKVKCDNIFNFLSIIEKTAVYLIIDDAHKAEKSRDFQKALGLLIQCAPENLYLAISSRNGNHLRAFKYFQYNPQQILTSHDLCFTEEEIKQLFGENHGLSINDDQAQEVERICGGWPFAVNRVAQHLSQSYINHPFRVIDSKKVLDKDFTKYLADEFLKDFPQGTEKFLVESCIFESFSVEMCEEILEQENINQIIEHLLSLGLLRVKSHSETDVWYEYPELFRNYFLNTLQERVSSHGLAKTNEIAGLYLNSENSYSEAVVYYLEAQSYEKATALLEQNLENIIAKSTAKELFDIIERFPRHYIKTRSVFSFARGWALFLLSDYKGALQLLETSLETAQEEKNTRIIGKSIRLIANIYFSLDKFSTLISFVRDWKNELSENNPAYPEILQVLAKSLGQLGHMQEAERAWNEIQKHSLVQGNSRFGLVVSAIKAYNFTFLLGRLREAEEALRDALEFFHINDSMDTYARLLGYYSSLKYIQGYFRECEELIQKAVSECGKTNQIFAQEPFLLLQAMNALDIGKPEFAKKALKKLQGNGPDSTSFQNNDEESVWKGYLIPALKAALVEYEGDEKQFLKHADTSLQLVNQRESFLDIYFVYTFLARRYIRVGELEYAKKLLNKLEARLSPIHTPYFKAHTWLLLASVLYDQGMEDTAGQYLKKSLHTAKENQYEYLFLYKERETTLHLQPFLLDEEEGFDFVCSILINLEPSGCEKLTQRLKEEAKTEKKILILQALADNACCDVEKEIRSFDLDKNREVRQTAKSAAKKLRKLPPLSLTVQTFGGFRLKVGQREVPPETWKRKKAVSLLAYFLLNPNRKIELEKLMERFFPGASPQKAKSHLQSLVSHLRILLEPGLPPKKESKYIKPDRAGYFFWLPEKSYVDVFDFERLAYEAVQAKKNGDYSKAFYTYQAAAAIYQGDFLPEAVYEEWVEERRARYKEEYIKILYGLAYGHFDRKQYAECEHNLKTLLYHDPLDEKAYQLLMKCYVAWGHRAKAIKTYLQCWDILEKELGILPERSFSELYHNILDQ